MGSGKWSLGDEPPELAQKKKKKELCILILK